MVPIKGLIHSSWLLSEMGWEIFLNFLLCSAFCTNVKIRFQTSKSLTQTLGIGSRATISPLGLQFSGDCSDTMLCYPLPLPVAAAPISYYLSWFPSRVPH